MKKDFLFILMVLSLTVSFSWITLEAQEDGEENFQKVFDEGLKAIQSKQYDKAIECFQKAIDISPENPASYYNIACSYSLKGDSANAILWLKKSLEMGFEDFSLLENDTDLDNIRNTEEFKEIMKKVLAPIKCPDLSLPDLEGKEISLKDFLGKVIILDFWATWCPPCREEIPFFIELYNDYKDKGLVIIGVSKEQVEKLKDFSNTNKINYIILRHPKETELDPLFESINAIPTTFIVNKEGFIVKKYVGSQEKSVFENDIKDLLGSTNIKGDEKLVKIFKEGIPGGFMEQNPDDTSIQEMAKKAASLLYPDEPKHKLLKVFTAATQVVAGLNYYFAFEIETPGGNVKWQVVMYKDLQGNCSISKKKEIK